MADSRRPPRRPTRSRHGLLDSLRHGTGELVQSMANEVVPPVVDAIDVDAVVQRIDIQAILESVDLDALLERVDLTRLVEQIDLEVVLQRVDLNEVLARIDIDALLERTEFGAVITRSGSAMASRGLDLVRGQGVRADAFAERWAARLMRRGPAPSPVTGPPTVVRDGGLVAQ